MEEIRSLSGTGFDELFAAFHEAFKDYERSWTETEFRNLLKRRGYVPKLSFGAFDAGRLVAFTLNAAGNFRGRRTAYDTGTGTIEAYRGKGLAAAIFQASLPTLRQHGMTRYLLEVLKSNTKAISVYTRLGFQETRTLNYFFQESREPSSGRISRSLPFLFKETERSILRETQDWWDFTPSWQNTPDAVERQPELFKVIGAYNDLGIAGYGVIEPSSGDIPLLAVRRDHGRQGVGSALLEVLRKYSERGVLKIINTDSDCEGITKFVTGNGIPLRGAQFEMVLELDR